jgi:hypothetical protein
LKTKLILHLLSSSAKHGALKNLQPGVPSLYNSCINYQRYASTVAWNTNTVPTACVRKDGMAITFRKHTLKITQSRQELAKLADEIEDELSNLCWGQEKLLLIPDSISDDRLIKLDDMAGTNAKYVNDNHYSGGPDAPTGHKIK